MTPSFIGLMATMLPGVRPSISLASRPTASTRPLILLMATMEGSLTTIPLPRAYTQVLAVPRSMARSLEKREKSERRLIAWSSSWLWLGLESGAIVRGRQNAVLAGVFHSVHRAIGGFQQFLRRRGGVGQRGDADRRGEANGQSLARQK